MKLSAFLPLIAALVGTVSADFLLYNTVPLIHGHVDDRIGGADGFAFFHEQDVPLNCTTFTRDPNKVDRIEFHTSWGHFTWYKNRDMNIVDLNDKVVGSCGAVDVLTESGEIDCWKKERHEGGITRHWYAAPAFRCNTKVW
ncbi:hypothetical protein B0T14DRAFT_565479 [Immersiella caudata]|uniref:Uncharacterized protein n=1 Tax=Immersiella caudata TaxID=314043 RepID=A0AA40C3N0_9PEZI|nr:hypothetical protein B0T14DRAFT_565479 [Immersiella caudata]